MVRIGNAQRRHTQQPRLLSPPHCSWMDHPDSATYDIVVVYYGASNATVDCPLCKAVFYSQGPKWQIVHTLSKQPGVPGYVLRWRLRLHMLCRHANSTLQGIRG